MYTALPAVLALSFLPGLGLAKYWKLLEHFGSLENLAHASLHDLQMLVKADLAGALHALFCQPNHPAREQASRCLEWCAANGVQLLSHLDAGYPLRLHEIHRAPPLLYVLGDARCLQRDQIALVGSRSASPGGKTKAWEMARDLAAAGWVVTSGLALGIDTLAHQGALAGCGQTVAVLGSSVDNIYPKANLGLAQQLIETGGCVVSEFPLSTAPSPENFPQRNRIISGLSVATVVVEAAEKSGSLITARYALEQNREVFAVPGSTQNPLARGCHALIKQGAALAESAEDILAELSGFAGLAWQRQPDSVEESSSLPPLDQQEAAVLEAVGYDPADLESIAGRLSLPIGELLAALLALELKGLISANASSYVRLV